MWIYKSGLSFESFVSSQSEYSKKYLEELNSEYEAVKDAQIPELTMELFGEFERSGSRIKYEREYFRRRAMLRDFALKAWLGDDSAINRLKKIMAAVCDEFTWALPAHAGGNDPAAVIDLFAAETAQTLCEIVSLIGDRLSGEICERAIKEVHKRVLDPFVNRSDKYNWEIMRSNWCAVCGGSVGMAAIYLTEDIAALKKTTASLFDTFENYMKSFSDDGACLEGLYYWGYGMMYLTAFLDLYRERTGEDFSVNTEKLKKMADFAYKSCMTNGITVSFSDSSDCDRVYVGLSSKLTEMWNAKAVEKEYMAYFLGDDCGRWCKAVRDIAWTRENTETKKEKASIFPSAQWTVIRDGNNALAFKGGNNGEPHNHNDIGSFVAVKNGEVILCDIGAGEYTREYFSEDRYNILCASSLGHSVPIVNGFFQKTGSNYAAKSFFADERGASADISGAYGVRKLKKCVRKTTLSDGVFMITDEFEAEGDTSITERFITRHKAEISADGAKIMSDGECLAALTADGDYKIKLSAFSHREHDGRETEITAIDFIFNMNGSKKFEMTVK